VLAHIDFFGEPVVKACVQNSTDYVDITGEPEFMENMVEKYHELAIKNKTLIVSACGFDCIPSEIGIDYTIQQFGSHEHVSSIESYVTMRGNKGIVGHYGTFSSLVHSIASSNQLKKMRRRLNENQAPLQYSGPKLPRKDQPFFNYELSHWCLPFIGADASVVKRTQRYLWETLKLNPIQFNAFFYVPSFFYILAFIVFGIFLVIFASFKLGRTLLLKYPKLFTLGYFSHEGPTLEQIKETTFTMIFYANGYKSVPTSKSQKPDKRVVTKIDGPDVGYVATSIFVVESALCILLEKSTINKFGVLTPGSAFLGTKIIDRLKNAGIGFSLVNVTQ